MTTYIIARQWVGNESTAQSLEEGIERLVDFNDIVAQRKDNITVGIKLTVTPPYHQHQAVGNTRALLKENGNILEFYDPQDRGAGTSLAQILFNSSFWGEKALVASLDLDQYIPRDEREYEKTINFIQSVGTDNSLMGIGSRSREVRLSTDDEANQLRIIHELINAIAAGKDIYKVETNRANPRPSGITPGYAQLGETTPGFYVVNTQHPQFPKLVANITLHAPHLTGFAMDYYLALKVPQLGKITTGYVPTHSNDFPPSDQQAQRQRAQNIIKTQTAALSHTDIRRQLAHALNNPATRKTVIQFYETGQVDRVLAWMKESMK